MPLDIIGLGEAMVELNAARGGGYVQGFGGDTSNAMVAAARSGARTGYITRVGDDPFGAALRGLWAAEGIDTAAVDIDRRAPTGIYFVTHGPQGHEFSYRRAGSAASLMTPESLPRAYIESARALHVSGISQAISEGAADTVFAAIDCARAAGRLVSYDTNLRLKLWPLARARAVTHEAMRSCDIALPGLEDARLLTGLQEPDAIADFYLHLGAAVVALTLGAQGALVATPEKRARIASGKVEAVDATGAGDTFDGAFLAEFLACGEAFRAGRYACAAAALSTRGFGAVGPMPGRGEVEAVLRERATLSDREKVARVTRTPPPPRGAPP